MSFPKIRSGRISAIIARDDSPECWHAVSAAIPFLHLAKATSEPPSGALWLHEIKHDGFRVIARKDGAQVRLYSRPGK